MDLLAIATGVLTVILALAFFLMYVMYVRIRQLTNELRKLRNRVEVTDDELLRLAKDIDEFKRLKIR